jgi:hypothetical protein
MNRRVASFMDHAFRSFTVWLVSTVNASPSFATAMDRVMVDSRVDRTPVSNGRSGTRVEWEL